MLKYKLLLFYFLIIINLIHSSDFDKLKDEILSKSLDKNIQYLFENPFQIIKLNDRFYYIYGVNPKDLNDESLPITKEIKIDDLIFKKEEMNWWCIFDASLKKLCIRNDENYYFWSKAGQFNKKHNLLYFNIGTYVDRHFKIFDLLNPDKKPNEFMAAVGGINGQREDILVSEYDKIVAYIFPINNKWPDENSEMGIKIRIIDTYKDLEIKSNKENISLEIVKFEKNKIIYKEIKNRGMKDQSVIKENLFYTLPL